MHTRGLLVAIGGMWGGIPSHTATRFQQPPPGPHRPLLCNDAIGGTGPMLRLRTKINGFFRSQMINSILKEGLDPMRPTGLSQMSQYLTLPDPRHPI